MSNLTKKHPQNVFLPLPPADGPSVTLPEQPVPGHVCDAVDRLIRSLNESFGVDYSFTVAARGHVIAASSAKQVVSPREAMLPETTYTRD